MQSQDIWWENLFEGNLAHGFDKERAEELNHEGFLYFDSEQAEEFENQMQ